MWREQLLNAVEVEDCVGYERSFFRFSILHLWYRYAVAVKHPILLLRNRIFK